MIFYYTATGNSLYVARKLDQSPVSIPLVLKKRELCYKDEMIGIVTPVHAGELPQTVRRFIKQAIFETKYFFMILTYGKDDSIAGIWSQNFCKENNHRVDMIQTIKMVDNYLPLFDIEEEISLDKKFDEQMKVILEMIQERKHVIKQPTDEGKKLYEIVHKRFHEHPELNNGEFIIMSDRCVGCSICTKVCPRGNIEIINNQAKRKSKTCDFCLACVHNCPFQSIDVKGEKNPHARYRHPRIALKDIVKSNYQGE